MPARIESAGRRASGPAEEAPLRSVRGPRLADIKIVVARRAIGDERPQINFAAAQVVVGTIGAEHPLDWNIVTARGCRKNLDRGAGGFPVRGHDLLRR